MANAPYGVRLLVGAAATVVEETRKLPQTMLMYPMTLASQAAHLVMRFQQNVADLVIKGDETLDALFPPKDEQPEWATFDEDLPTRCRRRPASATANGSRRAGSRCIRNRWTTPGAGPTKAGAPKAAKAAAGKPHEGDHRPRAPDIAVELDYDALTLAQLRARLQSLSVDDLDALLSYEEATKARAPFQTLLANRITRATAK